MQLFDIDVQPVATHWTFGLEVEDHANRVAGQYLLIKRAFNRINGLLVGVVPTRGKLAILDSPALDRLTRDSGSLGGVVDRALSR